MTTRTSTAKHAPATPLKIMGELQMKKIQHDMTILRRTNERLTTDRAKLVEALREQVQAFGARAADETDSPRIAKIRALLRELGEEV